MAEWPKKPTKWIDNKKLYVSVPFTWNLPALKKELLQMDFEYSVAIVGGPAVKLMPNYFDYVPGVFADIGDMPGVMQRVNPFATKTSVGCPNKCGFCAVPKTEPEFKELEDWPDLPVICDNNLLACSDCHFDKVMDRLEKWEGVDFNQGLDIRLINEHHIERIKRLARPKIRFACDSNKELSNWIRTVKKCIESGIKKTWISSYALIGRGESPESAWVRCNEMDKHCRYVNPQWFHELNQLVYNKVTNRQKMKGWNKKERDDIMSFFYMKRGKRKYQYNY